ncbi:MAG TPA: hypothetical protein V6C57_05960 [Coleofasciculaceae cyanobacterium]
MKRSKSHRMILGAIAALAVGSALSAAPAETAVPDRSAGSEQSDLPEFCSFHNAASQRGQQHGVEQGALQETVIVLGKLPNAPYVVVVPGGDGGALSTVRQCVPDAFQTRSRSGSYIHAGAFSRRGEAEELSCYLRALQLDARVMYLP